MFEKVVLILGGNKDDRLRLLTSAVESVLKKNELVSISKIYETEAWGGVAKGTFLNQVMEINTEYSPHELLDLIQKIETNLGRKRGEHWGDRTMDIDIIFFGKKVIDTQELKIPHSFIAERKFVLVPLAEILPRFVHPRLGKSIEQLLTECEDRSEVREYVV
jgi:2-amino-4-hydroxy-6-hydroxymethyldihydropteridine diphosphokinase